MIDVTVTLLRRKDRNKALCHTWRQRVVADQELVYLQQVCLVVPMLPSDNVALFVC